MHKCCYYNLEITFSNFSLIVKALFIFLSNTLIFLQNQKKTGEKINNYRGLISLNMTSIDMPLLKNEDNLLQFFQHQHIISFARKWYE